MKKEKEETGSYIITKFPKERIPTLDFLAISDNRHYIKGLFELDVTEGRQIIKDYKVKMGKDLSFTAWLLVCIGTAVRKHKEVHSLMKGRNKIITFDDVDISITVERKTSGGFAVMPLVIRKTNEKNIKDIHGEIRNAQKEVVKGPNVLGEHSIKK
jgi:pyruvate/2-oxoglutarate dehydrogenase complex dihydrolipoamide acyltransferase (E2) component